MFVLDAHLDLAMNAMEWNMAFIKNLFNGSVEEYQRVISQIQTYDDLEEAQNFIENLVKPDYSNWEGKESFESRFIKLIEQNFN